MTVILYRGCLNDHQEILPFLGPKCGPVGGEPRMVNPSGDLLSKILSQTFQKVRMDVEK